MAAKQPIVRKSDIDRIFSVPELAKQYPPILTVDQAASLLQVPKDTIYEWSSRGRLTNCARKVGKHLRIVRDALIREFFT